MNLQQKLLDWFKKHSRPLPWRRHYRPYDVWVSEVMLQQTQVETALPYFNQWMKAFPDIASLAKADEKKVLKSWEGLGYYSRARNLHESAKTLMREHSGKFPQDYEAILSLKGIGRYSAGAIASIAFNQDQPIVDGNVLRVLSRLYAIRKPIDVEKNKAHFWKLQKDLIPKGRARYFNQALMELGALVCKKENPLCESCPVQSNCKAYKNGDPEAYPVKQKKKKMVKVIAAALVVEKNKKFLIRKRPLGKIMGGLWEFPEWKLSLNRKLPLKEIKQKTLQNARRELGKNLQVLKYLGPLKRNYTHHLETLHVFEAIGMGDAKTPACRQAGGGRRGDLSERQDPFQSLQAIWATKKDFAKYPFSSAHAKIAKLIS